MPPPSPIHPLPPPPALSLVVLTVLFVLVLLLPLPRHPVPSPIIKTSPMLQHIPTTATTTAISVTSVSASHSTTAAASSLPHPPPQCTWRPDPGPCRFFFRRFYYDHSTHTCEFFVYGGCKGRVPFRTSQQCEAARCDLIVQSDINTKSHAVLKRQPVAAILWVPVAAIPMSSSDGGVPTSTEMNAYGSMSDDGEHLSGLRAVAS